MYIDSHAHLYMKQYDEDREELFNHMFENGVLNVVNISIDHDSVKQCIKMADEYKQFYATAGFHPTCLNGVTDDDIKEMRTNLQHEKVTAVGEIGLDFYHDTVDPVIQKKYFIKQLEMALEEDCPIVIHNREADAEVLRILKEVNNKYNGVFHCYAGNLEMAHELIDMGFYLSFNGVITFKNSDRGEIVKDIPLNKILLETDAPFLTPVPFRGKRNDSGKLIYIAEKIAMIKGVSVDEVAKITTESSKKLFSIR